MTQLDRIIIFLLITTVTVVIQIGAVRMKYSVVGLIMPASLFTITTVVLILSCNSLRVDLGVLEALSYYSVANVPTILLLCIYNFSKRRRCNRLR